VILPAYNEERQIGKVLETMPGYVDHVIVVDDGSTDATSEVCRGWQARMGSKLTVIKHPTNRGVGAAVVTGYKRSMELGLDVIALMAGDGQTAPDDLALIVEPVASGRADYSKGNRLFTGEAWRKTPAVRYLGNAFLSMLTKIASGYWHVADSQSGFTAISNSALHEVDLDGLWHSYGYPNDLLIQLNVRNIRVEDVPTHPRYGVGERSSMKVWKVIPTVSYLLWRGFMGRLFLKYVIKDFHPLVFFYFFGIAFVAIGTLLGVLEIVFKYVTGGVATATIVLDGILLISGLQFLLFAMWFDMEYNKSLKAAPKDVAGSARRAD
jgi:glycosyltransferase involved in cell wall biosynthesis